MTTQEHLTRLQQELMQHRVALKELSEEKAMREQAIADLKEALLAHGFACDPNPYDGLGDLPKPDEARSWVERALRGE